MRDPNNPCLFCNPKESGIAHENDLAYASYDTYPVSDYHYLIIPKNHIATINNLNSDNSFVIGLMFEAAVFLARKLGVAETGYRVVMNCNEDAGQTVFHIHLHFLAGRNLTWPPG